MRSRFVSATLAAFVAAASLAFAGYMSITKPVPAFEKVLEKGGILRGRTSFNGQPVLGTFSITKKFNGMTYAYDLKFYIAKDTAAPPIKYITAELRAVKDIVVNTPAQLYVDLRGYPSNSKASWSFRMDADGLVNGLLVKYEGTLGMGALEFNCPLAVPRQERFERLHQAE
jgi:hypothetical protein